MIGSRDSSHFARIYEANPDPWGFRTDPYELGKYRHSIEALGEQRFSSALEVGCSIGVLTRMLAGVCEGLLALDIVDAPLEAAAARCAEQPWVRFRRMQVPGEWPDQRFDLIVLSEVLYFLSPEDVDRCAGRVRSSILPGGKVLLVNWLGQSDDPCSGDEAAARFIAAAGGGLGIEAGAGFEVLRQDRQPGYRLDLLGAA